MPEPVPAPMQDRGPFRRRNLAVAAVVLAIAALGGWWYFSREPAAEGDAPKAASKDGKKAAGKGGARGGDPNRVQPVAAAAARKGDIRIIQTSLGTVTALSVVTVKPRVDGPLLSVNFKEGQSVRQGDVLAQIDPAPFEVALAQAEGQLARDQALLANARVDLDRYKTLLAQDSIARQQVDAQEAQVRQYEGTVKVDRAAVDNARLQLSYTKVVAPIGGRLGLRQVDPGNIVRAGDATGLVVITQVNPITAIFTIPQDSLPRVLNELRQGEKLEVEAWDREQKNRIATGTLITTDNQVDIATGTVKLKAQFPNEQGRLFPNQFVNVRMVVDVRKDVVVIPAAAVQTGPQGTVAYVVKEDGTVAMRPVRLGPAEGERVAVESGVQEGERVVTDGMDRLREGARVEVVQPSAPGGQRRGPPMDPAKREEIKKKLESASPEERKKIMEELRKQREAAQAQPPAEPAKAEPSRAEPVKQPAPAKASSPTDAPPTAAASEAERRREAFRNATPEEREKMREEFRKRMENATPEERARMREEFKKRREAQGQ